MSITTTHDVRQSLLAQDSEFRRLSEAACLLRHATAGNHKSIYLNAEDLHPRGRA